MKAITHISLTLENMITPALRSLPHAHDGIALRPVRVAHRAARPPYDQRRVDLRRLRA